MARFTTRVELHHAGEDDYNELHSAMEDQGFTRYIKTTDGRKLQLPTAEYNFDGSMGINGVLEAAKVAATSTGRKFEILVTESAGRNWEYLPEI